MKPNNDIIKTKIRFILPKREIDWEKVYEMIINDMGGYADWQPWV